MARFNNIAELLRVRLVGSGEGGLRPQNTMGRHHPSHGCSGRRSNGCKKIRRGLAVVR